MVLVTPELIGYVSKFVGQLICREGIPPIAFAFRKDRAEGPDPWGHHGIWKKPLKIVERRPAAQNQHSPFRGDFCKSGSSPLAFFGGKEFGKNQVLEVGNPMNMHGARDRGTKPGIDYLQLP